MSADDVIKAHVKALKEGPSVLKLDAISQQMHCNPGGADGQAGGTAGTQVRCQGRIPVCFPVEDVLHRRDRGGL